MTHFFRCAYILALIVPLTWTAPCLGQVTFNDYGSSGIYQDKIDIIKSTLSEDLTNTDVVITFGLSALQHQLSVDDKRPVVSLFVPSHTYQQTIINIPSDKKVSAIYADPNPLHLIFLTRILFKPSKILVPYTSETLSLLPLNKANVTNLFLTPGDTRGLIAATDQYDVVLALPDKTLYNATTIQPIVSSLYRRKKFIVSYSLGMLKSGALASIVIDTQDLVVGLEDQLRTFISKGSLPPASYSQSFSVSVNRTLASSLDINALDDDVIAKQIREKEGRNEN